MPAGSEPTPAGRPDETELVLVPHRFRPLGVRLAATVLGLALFGVTTVIWLRLPGEIQDQFSPFQRATVLFIGAAVLLCGHALARSRLDADAAGLTVVNGYKRRRYAWSQVVAVSLRPGSPWAVLDLSDGTTVAAMGIQGSDGPRATGQVRRLRALVAHHSRTERDD